MTALQMIEVSESVWALIECAAGPQPSIRISKSEAKRLVKEWGLPNEDVGTVHLSGTTCSIIFAT